MNPISNTLLILFLASCATTGTLAQEPTYFPTAFNDTAVAADDAFPTYEPTYPPTTDGTYSPTEGGTSAETETTTSNSTDVEGDDDDQVDDAVDDDLADVNATSFDDDDDDVNATEAIADDDEVSFDDAFFGNETATDDFSDVINSTDVDGDNVNATEDADDDNNATASTTELVTSSPVAAVVFASPTAAPATVEPESNATTAPTYVDSTAMEVTLAPTPAITRDDNGTEEETVDEDDMDDGIRDSTEPIFAAISEEANSGMSVMTSSLRSRLMISMVGVGVVSIVAGFITL